MRTLSRQSHGRHGGRGAEHEEETDSEGSWAISYGDMITLLLAFFVLFFTTDPKKEHADKMTEAVLTTLQDKMKAVGAAPGRDEHIKLGDKAETGIDPIILEKWKGVAMKSGNKILIAFPGVSFFRSGKVDVTNEGQKALATFVDQYMPFAGQFVVGIRAYADTKAVRLRKRHQRFNDNLELSALRSVATMRILQKSGIPLTQMTLGGFGELKVTADELARLPANAGRTQLDLARKVVLVIQQTGREAL